MGQFHYWIFYFIAGLGMFAVAGWCWSRRHSPGASGLIIVCLSTGFWAVCEGLLCFGWETVVNLRITQIQYLGIVTAPLAMLFFVLGLFGLQQRVPTGVLAFSFVPPTVTLALAWTNDAHRLIWTHYENVVVGDFPMLALTHGPAFYGWVAFNYLLMATVTVILLQQVRRSIGPIRAQARMILTALIVIWLANGVYISGNSPLAHADPTPLAFAILAMAMAWGLFRHGLLDLTPVAKDEIFSSIMDGVVVLNRDGRVIDLNPAAEKTFGVQRREAVGQLASALGIDIGLSNSRKSTEEEIRQEVALGAGRVFDLRVSVLRNRRGRLLGHLQVWHDVTARKEMEEKLERMAQTDPLTGACNRRRFMEVARRELARAGRYDNPLSLVVMDVDYFKRINDTYGHAFGDDVLKAVVAACMEALRENDVFGRVGGEEFAVVCVETTGEEAVQVAQRLRRRLTNLPLETSRTPLRVTASFGVASRREGDERLKELFQRADEALYRAKAAGRNRVAEEKAEGRR